MEPSCVSRFNPNDDNLMSSALQGNEDALQTLFTRYRRLLYSLAHRLLRNHEEAEDAVQNCMLLAFRNLPRIKCQGSFRSWLARIVMNEALAIVRKKKSRPIFSSEQPFSEELGEWVDRFPAPGPNPEQAFANWESVGALMTHVVRLPTPLRSAILLCDIGEHTIEEAGTVLGLAPNTVKARLHRGRIRLGLTMRRSCVRVNSPDQLIGV